MIDPRDPSNEMQMITNLAAEGQVSYAQIEGAILKFKKALREFETHCLEKLDAGHSMLDANILDHLSDLTRRRSEIRDRSEQILQGVTNVTASCLEAVSEEPVFLIFLQRT